MSENINTRRTERLTGSNWERISMLDLCVNDIFRLYDSDGSLVLDSNGNNSWRVVEKPFVVNGVNTVMSDIIA